jgi:hypothetical protein
VDQASEKTAGEVPTPQTARGLDATVRGRIENLLNTAGVRKLNSYGWLDADAPDPEFIGHAMWQVEPPFEHDYGWSIRRRGGRATRTPPREPTETQQLLAVAGVDFDGLMDAARMSIGLFLLQADVTREFQLHDDKFRDLHYMSAVIYLATASERIREFFIAAAFRVPQEAYQTGSYEGQRRSWYTTPFLEARDALARSSPELSDPLSKALPLAEHIRELRDTRNALIHELATAMGQRERQRFQQRPEAVEPEDYTFEDFQKSIKAAAVKIEEEISAITTRLARWYELLVRLSNEAFIVEHERRRGAG